MSPIGRIFIVLNLVLSAAFVGWAGHALSKATDYKARIEGLEKAQKDAVAAKDKELGELTVAKDAVSEQQRTMREQRDSAQAEVDRQKTQLEEYKRSSDAMQGNLTKIQATLGDYNNSIAQLSQQKDAAVERSHEAERARDAAVQEKEAALVAQRDAEEAKGGAETRIADLEAEANALREQVETLNTRIQVAVEKSGMDFSDIEAQKPINAYVLDVNRDLKLVVLNKGKKDEVKAGYVFDIYRGNQYKGRVRIQNVQDGMSSGLIVNEKSAITTGDSATTTL